MMQLLGNLFGWIMYYCYQVTHHYVLTIILFTVVLKIILLPVSIMVQKNSIKMVKMYPEINRIKVKYFGNKDMISEEQYQLYKAEQYHPMFDLIPVILQLVILMGVINVIYNPYVIDPDINLLFAGLDLALVPIRAGGLPLIIPLAAALSAWVMCIAQNKANVLQAEQGRLNKTVTLLISVGLSLYLGFFVPGGVGFYWIVSNLLSIVQLYILNYFINPKKYIDYDDLAASKKELEDMNRYAAAAESKKNPEYAAREKEDYKKFLKYGAKQLVFYSEGKGFYKYFRDVIELILKKTDITIHYITSDPLDEVFDLQTDHFRVYYIGENKLIVLMMKMDADMVVMTMPDLQKYHIKRSMVRDDIEYVYMDHGIGSINLMLRKHALDYFDTIFASNDIVYREIRGQEAAYHLKEKTIIKYGFSLIDNMIADYQSNGESGHDTKVILIAPSWQEDNMLDLYIDVILQHLLGQGYQIILRPHPQYVRHYEHKLNALRNKYAAYPDFVLQTDFSSNDTVFNADILMTDWSGIAYEYSFTTLKPALFVNTPMKIMNPDYQEIDVVPFDIEIRDQIGISIEPENLNDIKSVVEKLLTEKDYSRESIGQMREKYLYNVSHSAEVGAQYIINRLIEMSRQP